MFPAAIASVLTDQSGVISRRRLVMAGARPHDIQRWRRRKELVIVHPGVYVGHTGPLTCSSAPGLPCSTWLSTSPIESPRWSCWPVRCRSDGPPLPRCVTAWTGAHGPRTGCGCRGCCATWPPAPAPVLEQGYLTDVERAHGLPTARRQVAATASVGLVYRDNEYEAGVVVELDGRLFHDSARQRDLDFERDLDAAVDGKATRRLSYGQVFGRPCSTAGKIARLLSRGGWQGRPQPCGPRCVAPAVFDGGLAV